MLRRCCALGSGCERQSADASISSSAAHARRRRGADLGLSARRRGRLLQEAVRLGIVAPQRAHRAADLQLRLRRPAARLRPGLQPGLRLRRQRLAAGLQQIPDAVRAHVRRLLFPHRRQRRPRAAASGCARVHGALRRRGQAVLLPDQRRQRRNHGRHGRAPVRADGDGVPLPQDAGAGLHVQTGAVVGGERRAPPGLQGRGAGAGRDARRRAAMRDARRSPATAGRKTATVPAAARSKPTCSARAPARSRPPGTAASAAIDPATSRSRGRARWRIRRRAGGTPPRSRRARRRSSAWRRTARSARR